MEGGRLDTFPSYSEGRMKRKCTRSLKFQDTSDTENHQNFVKHQAQLLAVTYPGEKPVLQPTRPYFVPRISNGKVSCASDS
jgi:hypothetical protein